MCSPLLALTTALTGFFLGLLPFLSARVPPAVSHRWSISPGWYSLCQKFLVLTQIFLMFLAGLLFDGGWGQPILFMGTVATTLSLGYLGLAQRGRALVLARSLQAFAMAGLVTTLVLVPRAYFIPDPHAFPALSVGLVFVSLGALTGPFLVLKLETRFGFRQAYLGLALFTLVPAAGVALLPPDLFSSNRGSLASAAAALQDALLHDLRLGLLALGIFLYFILERVLQAWVYPQFEHMGCQGRALVFFFGCFWMLFLGVRLATAWLVWPGYELWLLVGLVFLTVIILGNLAGSHAPPSGKLGLCLVGGCLGPIFPILLGEAYLLYPENQAAVLCGLYSLAIFNPVLLGLNKSISSRISQWLIVLTALALAAPLLVLALLRKS